ncbi:MAG: hypothetical protein GY851_22900 [bacterium]|nr:hypothetical protein [bacterium]
MTTNHHTRALLIAAVLFLAVCATASAENDAVIWLNPGINDFEAIGEFEAVQYGTAEVDRRSADFGMATYDLRLRLPFGRTETSEWIVSGDVELIDTTGSPRLRRTRSEVPGELYDVSFGAMYRHLFDNDWLAGVTLSVGSASDTPFGSMDEVYGRAGGFVRIPHLKYTAFLVYLDINTARSFPVVPGVGYQFPISRQAWAMLGLPIVATGGKIGERVSFFAFYQPPGTVDSEIAYHVSENWAGSLGFDWHSGSFALSDRRDKDDRFVIAQKRFKAGVEYRRPLDAEGAYWKAELLGGYAFDRTIAEGEDIDERDERELEVDNTWFAGLDVEVRF